MTLSKQNLTTQDQKQMTAKGYNDGEGSKVAVRGGSATWKEVFLTSMQFIYVLKYLNTSKYKIIAVSIKELENKILL